MFLITPLAALLAALLQDADPQITAWVNMFLGTPLFLSVTLQALRWVAHWGHQDINGPLVAWILVGMSVLLALLDLGATAFASPATFLASVGSLAVIAAFYYKMLVSKLIPDPVPPKP